MSIVTQSGLNKLWNPAIPHIKKHGKDKKKHQPDDGKHSIHDLECDSKLGTLFYCGIYGDS